MKIRIFMGGLVLALSTFTLNGDKVSAEELTVATFIPPQHHINKNLFGWFGKEIAQTIWWKFDNEIVSIRPTRCRPRAAI